MEAFTTTPSTCAVCGQRTKNSFGGILAATISKRVDSQLWNYLYHQNVRETIACSGGEEYEDSASLPKLTFTISAARSVPSARDKSSHEALDICQDCNTELERLDNLHQELEAMKKTVECQIRKINNRQRKAATLEDNSTNRLRRSNLSLQMSLAASVTGKENIALALKFLNNMYGANEHENSALTSTIPDPVMNDTTTSQLRPHSKHLSAPKNKTCDDWNSQDNQKIKLEKDVEDTKMLLETLNSEADAPEDDTEVFESSFILPSQLPSSSTISYMPVDPLDTTTENGTNNRTLSSSAQLKRQTNAKGERTPCPVCGKALKVKCLKGHMRVHSGEKPYRCEFCNKQFGRLFVLKVHRRIHTGEKPHSCDLCNRRFASKAGLRSHRISCQM